MGGLIDPLHKERSVRFQNTLAVPAHLARRHRVCRPIALMPLHRRRNGNPETRGGKPAAFPCLDRTNNTLTKIIG
jgi:hypothetical protein